MIFGAISNSWRQHLSAQDLSSLIEEAQSRGARHIELRQTCLGDCESGEGDDWRPVLSGLQSVVERFPEMSFDLAMGFPCLTRRNDPQGEQFQQALAAARLVGKDTPHLRLVDQNPSEGVWERAEEIPDEAMGIVDLAREAARQGVILSMENSSQPIRSMALLVQEARSQLAPEEGGYLGLCPDPTNQLRRYPDSDPLSELDALPLDMLKIVHFKQSREYRPHPTVDTGDLDCGEMLRLLDRKGYGGPAIMEIPPHDAVFDNLSASFEFLNAAR